jgi:hypothetical protein
MAFPFGFECHCMPVALSVRIIAVVFGKKRNCRKLFSMTMSFAAATSSGMVSYTSTGNIPSVLFLQEIKEKTVKGIINNQAKFFTLPPLQ